MVGESSSKSKTAGSICIRWKIRRKLGELRTSGTVLKFRNWKLETLRRRPTACICRSLKETAFLFVTSLSFLRRSLEIYAGNPSHRDSIVESGLKSREIRFHLPPRQTEIHRILFRRKGNRFFGEPR